MNQKTYGWAELQQMASEQKKYQNWDDETMGDMALASIVGFVLLIACGAGMLFGLLVLGAMVGAI